MTTGSVQDQETDQMFPQRQIAHLGYGVGNIRDAVDHWVKFFGAGPFFTLDDVHFDLCEHRSQPAVFEHATAVGQWGSIAVELWETRRFEPAALRSRFLDQNRLTHIAFNVDDIEAEAARLEHLGCPEVLRLEVGVIKLRLHDAPRLGHMIEIVPASDLRLRLDAEIAEAAEGWDGSDPLRPAHELPALNLTGL